MTSACVLCPANLLLTSAAPWIVPEPVLFLLIRITSDNTGNKTNKRRKVPMLEEVR